MALLEQNIARQPYPVESYVFSRFAGVAYIKAFTGLALFVFCSFPLTRMVEERGVYRVLVGETGGKESTGET